MGKTPESLVIRAFFIHSPFVQFTKLFHSLCGKENYRKLFHRKSFHIPQPLWIKFCRDRRPRRSVFTNRNEYWL